MIGQIIGNYRITALLGEGGMGKVYLAEHPGLGRRAAFKLLHRELASDAEMVSRFFNEARASNAVRHSAIVDIYDYGKLDDGSPYIVMEFLDGESLTDRIQRGGLTVGEAVEFAAQLASGLASAHRAGVVHRDLKPDNIFLASLKEDPTRRTIKILDFGIAKLQKTFRGSSEHKTRTGALMGTPSYMSPEQCRGIREVDHRSDIYSLGVILYELATGTPPFVSHGVGELINLHINVVPRPPTELNPNISPELQRIILRALEKSPEDRFDDMDQFYTSLRAEGAALGSRADRGNTLRGALPVPHPSTTGPMVARPTTLSIAADIRKETAPPTPAPRRKNMVLAGGAALIAFAVVGVALRGNEPRHGVGERPPVAPQPVAAAVITPPAVVDDRAAIVLESTPAGAQVYVDDAIVATTPGTAVLAHRGDTITFRFVLPGHRDETLKAVASDGLKLHAQLNPEAMADPAPAVRVRKSTRKDNRPSPNAAQRSATPPLRNDLDDIKSER